MFNIIGSNAIGAVNKGVYWNGSAFVNMSYTINANIPTGTNNGVVYYNTTSNVTSTSAGAVNTALMGNGTSQPPKFVSVSPSLGLTAGTSSTAPKLNVTILGVVSNDITLTTATTGVYGVTKLNDSTNSTSTALAATANAVKTAYDLANTANTTANNHKYWGNVEATSAAQYDKEP